MDVYHGTSTEFATLIIGPPHSIDITRGRGELGRGFYAGNEPSLAATLARGRHASAASVLQLSIETEDYLTLNIKIVKTAAELNLLWEKLKNKKETTTHLFNTDVVVAPFATIDFAHQYKFESSKAEVLLNSCIIKKVL